MRQNLKKWGELISNKKHYAQIISLKREENNMKLKQKALLGWSRKYQSKKMLNEILNYYTKLRLKKILNAFKSEIMKKITEFRIIENFKTARCEFYMKKCLQILKNNVEQNQIKKKLNIKAANFCRNLLSKKYIFGWKKIINPMKNTSEYEILEKKKNLRNLHKKFMKNMSFNMWKGRANKAMRKAKSILIFSNGLRKMFMGIWLNKYKNENKFFNDLNDRVNLGRELCKVQVFF